MYNQIMAYSFMRRISVLLFVFLSAPAYGALSEDAIIKIGTFHKVELNKNLEFLYDDSKVLTIKDVSGTESPNFKKLTNFNFGFENKGNIWVKFTLDFTGYESPEWYLAQQHMFLKTMTLYYPDKDGYQEKSVSLLRLASSRIFDIRSVVIDAPTPATKVSTYYLKIEPGSHSFSLVLDWFNDKGIVEHVANSEFLVGLFSGGLFILWLYNLVIYLMRREKLYVYYLYYLGSFQILYVYLNGYSTKFFPLTHGSDIFFAVFGYGTIHGMTLFTRSYLDLKTSFTKMDTAFKYLSYCLLTGLISIFVIPINPYISLSALIIIAMIFMGVSGATMLLKKESNYLFARYFMAGWSIFIVTILLYVTRALGFISPTFISMYGMMFASLWEAVIFALALSFRFKKIEEENLNQMQIALDSKNNLNKSLRTFEHFKMQLGQELHDEFGQRLVTLRFGAGILSNNPPADTVISVSGDMVKTILDMQASIDQIIEGMWPPVLESLGFEKAVISVIDNYRVLYPDVTFNVDIQPAINKSVEAALQNTIYRITQEGLTNIMNHAQASHVSLKIAIKKNDSKGYADISSGAYYVEATLLDNGCGFDVKTVKYGQGITGMKRRVDELNGTFEVVSCPNNGTSIIVKIPCRGDISL